MEDDAITLENALFFSVPIKFKIATGSSTISSHHVITIKRGSIHGIGEGFNPLHVITLFVKNHADRTLHLISKYDFGELRKLSRLNRLRLPMSFEIALTDLLAREKGLRACELLGKPFRERIPVFRTIPLDGKKMMVRLATRLASKGWGIKLKIGLGVEHDLELVKAVRNAIGPDVPLIVDANQAYPPGVALHLFKRMERYGLSAIEQPCSKMDLRAHSALRNALDTPIMLDESVRTLGELERAVKARALDVLNLKLCRVGGLLKALDLLDACIDMGIRLYIGTGRELGVGAAMLLHIASIVPRGLLHGCEVGWWFFTGFDVLKRPLAFRDGEMEVPKEPGLGVELADDVWLRQQIKQHGGRVFGLKEAYRISKLRLALIPISDRLRSLPQLLANPYYLANELMARMRGL